MNRPSCTYRYLPSWRPEAKILFSASSQDELAMEPRFDLVHDLMQETYLYVWTGFIILYRQLFFVLTGPSYLNTSVNRPSCTYRYFPSWRPEAKILFSASSRDSLLWKQELSWCMTLSRKLNCMCEQALNLIICFGPSYLNTSVNRPSCTYRYFPSWRPEAKILFSASSWDSLPWNQGLSWCMTLSRKLEFIIALSIHRSIVLKF